MTFRPNPTTAPGLFLKYHRLGWVKAWKDQWYQWCVLQLRVVPSLPQLEALPCYQLQSQNLAKVSRNMTTPSISAMPCPAVLTIPSTFFPVWFLRTTYIVLRLSRAFLRTRVSFPSPRKTHMTQRHILNFEIKGMICNHNGNFG
jgi:hypothetical protein